MSNSLDAAAAGNTDEETVSELLDEIHDTLWHDAEPTKNIEPQFAKLPNELKSEKNILRAAELHKLAAMSYYFERREDRERLMSSHLSQSVAYARQLLTPAKLAAFEVEISAELVKKGMAKLALPLLQDATEAYEHAGMGDSVEMADTKQEFGINLALVLASSEVCVVVGDHKLGWSSFLKLLKEAELIYKKQGKSAQAFSCRSAKGQIFEQYGKDLPGDTVDPSALDWYQY